MPHDDDHILSPSGELVSDFRRVVMLVRGRPGARDVSSCHMTMATFRSSLLFNECRRRVLRKLVYTKMSISRFSISWVFGLLENSVFYIYDSVRQSKQDFSLHQKSSLSKTSSL